MAIRKFALAVLVAVCSAPALAQSPVDLGRLVCSASDVQNRIFRTTIELDCEFVRITGGRESYTATVRRKGVNLSVKDQMVVIWAVTLAGDARAPDSLAGTFVGAGAEIAVGAGGGMRMLVGGGENAVTLSPTSYTGVTGVGVSLGVEEFVLSPAS